MKIYNSGKLGKRPKEVDKLIRIIEERVDELMEKGNNDGLLARVKTATNPEELAETYKILFGETYEYRGASSNKNLIEEIPEAQILEETAHEDLGEEVDIETENKSSATSTQTVKTPFNDPVIKRDYTQGDATTLQNEEQVIDHIPEPTEPDFVLPPEPQKDEPKGEKAKPFANPALKEMEADQKRKAAKVAAGAIMTFFKKFQDKPFKWICKQGITEADLEKAALAGELDIDEQLMIGEETMLTVNQFFANIVSRIDDSFVLDAETEKEIHDALIDVLIEQGVGMTPTQRLLAAVAGWAIQQVAQVVAFKQEISGAMSVVKDNYKGKMEIERAKLEEQREANRLTAELIKIKTEETKAKTAEAKKATKAVKDKNEKNESKK